MHKIQLHSPINEVVVLQNVVGLGDMTPFKARIAYV